jgi:lipid-binding SYLF domain-containing protein
MKFLKLFLTIIFLGICFSNVAAADSYSKTISVFNKSEVVQPFFKNCYGYAVFPTVGKGGIVVGGSYGEGKVYKGGKVTGTTTLAKVSIGFQLGGQAFSQIIFFQDKRAYGEFINGNFEFDASASAVAITAGVQAKAGTEGVTAGASAGPATGEQANTRYRKGMVIFVHVKGGLMYEASIGGQKFTFQPN